MCRDPLGTHDLDAPPGLVEEREERLDQLGEALVESPLVLGVLAVEPVDDAGYGLARVTR